MCPVLAAVKIYNRSIRMGVPDDAPLSAYLHKGKLTYISHGQVEKEMQATAKLLYNLTLSEDIGRYTAHSVRVGACVALHATGADTTTIQFRLRW